MADQSTQSIVIDASPAEIMAVIADFPNYPVWTGSIKSAQVLATGDNGRAQRVAFELDGGIIVDQYELDYVWTGDHKVEWVLTKGLVMKAQEGAYTLSADESGGTLVTYYLNVDLAIPMLGMLKRKAERVIMDIALNELKKRVETLAGRGAVAEENEPEAELTEESAPAEGARFRYPTAAAVG